METQTTNQQQCDHGRWLEANVGQQYRKGLDRLLRLNDVNSTDNNQPRKLKPAVGSRTRSILTFNSHNKNSMNTFNVKFHLIVSEV